MNIWCKWQIFFVDFPAEAATGDGNNPEKRACEANGSDYGGRSDDAKTRKIKSSLGFCFFASRQKKRIKKPDSMESGSIFKGILNYNPKAVLT